MPCTRPTAQLPAANPEKTTLTSTVLTRTTVAGKTTRINANFPMEIGRERRWRIEGTIDRTVGINAKKPPSVAAGGGNRGRPDTAALP